MRQKSKSPKTHGILLRIESAHLIALNRYARSLDMSISGAARHLILEQLRANGSLEVSDES